MDLVRYGHFHAFSLFVQAAEGCSTYGIVPYVDPPATGSIAGIVGAGGNAGAVRFGLGFRQLSYEAALMIMGFMIFGSGLSRHRTAQARLRELKGVQCSSAAAIKQRRNSAASCPLKFAGTDISLLLYPFRGRLWCR